MAHSGRAKALKTYTQYHAPTCTVDREAWNLST